MTVVGVISRNRRLAAQLPEVAAELARLVDSGSSLANALGEVSRRSIPPVRDELVRVVSETRHGRPIDEALVSWSGRSGREDVSLLVAACRLGSSEGGNLVVALDGVSAALHDALELADEAAALTSQARTSALVLAILPFIGLVMFATLEPAVGSFVIGSPTGWLLLTIGVLLDGLGAALMVLLVRWSLR